MSKNFELMQRAGKLLEIELPRSADPVGAPSESSMTLPLTPAMAPSYSPSLAPASSERLWTKRGKSSSALDHVVREESHRLIQQVFLGRTQDSPRVVVFAGLDHGNGCSRICANAAEVLHENVRGSICLVEANFRSPSLPELYGTTSQHGLTDALASEAPMKSFAKPVRGNTLHLMSCGSSVPNSQSLLNSERLRTRFKELRNEFDFVIVDAPPLLRYSDAIALGRVADGFVLVLEANATRREPAIQVTAHLRASQIRILGAVLNKRTFPIPDSLYRRL